jgi:hypothetical protein
METGLDALEALHALAHRSAGLWARCTDPRFGRLIANSGFKRQAATRSDTALTQVQILP